jgi:hypothetical protein
MNQETTSKPIQETVPPPQVEEKKPYHAPEMRPLGALAELTQFNITNPLSGADGGTLQYIS